MKSIKHITCCCVALSLLIIVAILMTSCTTVSTVEPVKNLVETPLGSIEFENSYPAREAYRAQCLVRALENNIFVASANRARSLDANGNLYQVGGSSIIAPWGEVLAEVDEAEDVGVAELDFARAAEWSDAAADFQNFILEYPTTG